MYKVERNDLVWKKLLNGSMCGHVSMEQLSAKGTEHYRKWPIVNQVCFRVILEPSSVLEFECVVGCFLLADDDIFQNVIINSQVKNEK